MANINNKMMINKVIKRNGKRVDFFMPQKVMKYIEQNNLYRGD